MTELVVYRYDPQTGFIDMRVGGERKDDDPILAAPNHVAVTKMIPAEVKVVHHDGATETRPALVDSSWFFVLDKNGNPAVDGDGNYLVNPPTLVFDPPDLVTHIFKAMANKGDIDIAEVDRRLLDAVNWSLDAAGILPISGTTVNPLPVRTAVTDSSGVRLKATE